MNLDAMELLEENDLADEVLHWTFDDNGYHAFTAQGRSLNIVHSQSLQPPIADENDYHTWLWLETLQGFFLARQRILEAAPQGWWLVRQIVPETSYLFFHLFGDQLSSYVVNLIPEER